jgi:DNA-binding IclR family transcriptional regulator
VSSSSGTQAVDRALRIVALIVQAEEPITSSHVAADLDLAKSTASRLLSALEAGELIESSDLGYVAGPLFWLYAARHDPWEETARLADPVMQKVASESRETVHLGVARQGQMVHVAQVDTDYLLGPQDWTQRDVPPHASAIGKVLYAHGALSLPEAELDELTPRTVSRPGTLLRQLAQVRERGYAAAVDELEIGLTAVAAPVSGVGSRVFGALGVSGPTSRINPRLEEFSRLLIDQAAELSAVLRRRTSMKEGAA